MDLTDEDMDFQSFESAEPEQAIGEPTNDSLHHKTRSGSSISEYSESANGTTDISGNESNLTKQLQEKFVEDFDEETIEVQSPQPVGDNDTPGTTTSYIIEGENKFQQDGICENIDNAPLRIENLNNDNDLSPANEFTHFRPSELPEDEFGGFIASENVTAIPQVDFEESTPDQMQAASERDGFGDFEQSAPDQISAHSGDDDFGNFSQAARDVDFRDFGEAEVESGEKDFCDYGMEAPGQPASMGDDGFGDYGAAVPQRVPTESGDEDFGDFNQEAPDQPASVGGDYVGDFGNAITQQVIVESGDEAFGDVTEEAPVQAPIESEDEDLGTFGEAASSGNENFGDFGHAAPEQIPMESGDDDLGGFGEVAPEQPASSENDDFGEFGEAAPKQAPVESGDDNFGATPIESADDSFGEIGVAAPMQPALSENDDFGDFEDAAPEQTPMESGDDDFGDFGEAAPEQTPMESGEDVFGDFIEVAPEQTPMKSGDDDCRDFGEAASERTRMESGDDDFGDFGEANIAEMQQTDDNFGSIDDASPSTTQSALVEPSTPPISVGYDLETLQTMLSFLQTKYVFEEIDPVEESSEAFDDYTLQEYVVSLHIRRH
jgi:hypothetical protein